MLARGFAFAFLATLILVVSQALAARDVAKGYETIRTCWALKNPLCPVLVTSSGCSSTSVCKISDQNLEMCCCEFGHPTCDFETVSLERSLKDDKAVNVLGNSRELRIRRHRTRNPSNHHPRPTKSPTQITSSPTRRHRHFRNTTSPSKGPTYALLPTNEPTPRPTNVFHSPTSFAPTPAPTLPGTPYHCLGCTVYINKTAETCQRSGTSCLDTNSFVTCCCAGGYKPTCGSTAPTASPTRVKSG